MKAAVTNPVLLRDIRSQGGVLKEGLVVARREASALDIGNAHRVVLTGSGDSFIAALAVHALFDHHADRTVLSLPSLDAGRYVSFERGDLLVAISVSGEVVRTVEAAQRARSAGATVLAITANPGSRLAASSEGLMTLPEPLDRSIPHCRDYTAALLVLAALLERLASRTLPPLDLIPALTNDTVSRCLVVGDQIGRSGGRTWFLGAGPDRASAMYGALKFWEAAGMEAWWDDLEEFGHGSQLMARPGDRAVLIAAGPGCQRALEVICGLERMGLEIVLVGGEEMSSLPHQNLLTTDQLEARWHPFLSCVPLQVLTFLEAEARGLNVSVPLFGQPHGPAYDEVHVQWVRGSRVVLDQGSAP